MSTLPERRARPPPPQGDILRLWNSLPTASMHFSPLHNVEEVRVNKRIRSIRGSNTPARRHRLPNEKRHEFDVGLQQRCGTSKNTAGLMRASLLLVFAIYGARGQWHRLAGGLGPRMRYSHGAAVADGLQGTRRLLVSHGYNKQHGPEFLDDTWARTLPNGHWEAVKVGAERPAARLGHSFGEMRTGLCV